MARGLCETFPHERTGEEVDGVCVGSCESFRSRLLCYISRWCIDGFAPCVGRAFVVGFFVTTDRIASEQALRQTSGSADLGNEFVKLVAYV